MPYDLSHHNLTGLVSFIQCEPPTVLHWYGLMVVNPSNFQEKGQVKKDGRSLRTAYAQEEEVIWGRRKQERRGSSEAD